MRQVTRVVLVGRSRASEVRRVAKGSWTLGSTWMSPWGCKKDVRGCLDDGKMSGSWHLCLFIRGHVENMQFILGKIHGHKIILGHDWLMLHNPGMTNIWTSPDARKNKKDTQIPHATLFTPQTPCQTEKPYTQRYSPKILTKNYQNWDLELTASSNSKTIPDSYNQKYTH